MAPPLRWGLLGTARINRLLIPAIRATGRSVVAAVASRDRQRAVAFAAAWTIPTVHASYEALLDADVDIVYVPLPNSLHAPWTLRAVAAGKHVLCEKPLALTVADVDAIAGAAARHHRVVTEGFMYRHHAQTLRVAAMIAAGDIGEVRTIAGAFTYPQQREHDVRLVPELGGGALWDVGCYPVSFAQTMAGGAPVSVFGSHRLGPSGVDEQFAGTITYANGADAQIIAGFRAAYHTFIRITGTTGTIALDRPFRPEPPATIRLIRDNTIADIEVTGSPIFVDEIADMEDAALGVRPPRILLRDSRTLTATLVALHESARTGRVVALPADRAQ